MPEHHKLFITSDDFLAGHNQAVIDLGTKYKNVHSFDDTGLTCLYIRISSLPDKTDLWRMGYFSGFYAGLYGVPQRWSTGSGYEHVLHFGLNGIRSVAS